MSMIVGLLLGFKCNIDVIRSLNCFEKVGVMEGYEPPIILTASVG